MWAQLIPAAVQLGTTLLANKKRDPFNETMMQDQVNALEASRTYEDAALNPQSPHAVALRKMIEAEQRQKVMQAIDALMRNQNRARARGVLGALVNPERRDEAKAGGIAEAFAQIGQKSGAAASDRLMSASQSARGRAGGYNSINQLLTGYANQNVASQNAPLEAISKLFQTQGAQDALAKIFGGNAPGGDLGVDIRPPSGIQVGDTNKSIFVGR